MPLTRHPLLFAGETLEHRPSPPTPRAFPDRVPVRHEVSHLGHGPTP